MPITKEQVLSVIQAAIPNIQKCCRGHSGEPDVKMHWTIGCDGVPLHPVAIGGSENPAAPCIVKEVGTWQFEPPSDHTKPITFPFRCP